MSIKILGGNLKGLSIKVGPASQMRPTSVLLRRKVFDSMQCLDGYIFWDLCAGSGSMGIEAMSRGANKVNFFEKSPRNFNILKSNIDNAVERLPALEGALVARRGNFSLFSTYMNKNESNIIFFDPPYKNDSMYDEFFKILSGLKTNQAWVEMDKEHYLKYIDKIKLFEHKTYEHSDKFICKLYLK